MSDERAKILNMLKQGKIDVSEAEELIDAIESRPSEPAADPASEQTVRKTKNPKYLCVMVKPADGRTGKGERVNVRVPLQLLRAGMKLASVIPDGVKGQVYTALKAQGLDISLDNLRGDKLDELIESLCELSIDVDSEDEEIKICCE